MLTQFVTIEVQHLPTLLDQLEPKEKAEYIIKLLPYILPKKAPVEEPKGDSQNERKQLLHNMFKSEMSLPKPAFQARCTKSAKGRIAFLIKYT